MPPVTGDTDTDPLHTQAFPLTSIPSFLPSSFQTYIPRASASGQILSKPPETCQFCRKNLQAC